MGGCESDMFRYFKVLLLQGFIAARKARSRWPPYVFAHA
jgi:hypothetical protein